MPPRKAKLPARPRKIPLQERSRNTVDVIVEAATRILFREGADALSTNRIAEVAGVSVGSLYQYFPNREAIVTALMERLSDVVSTAFGALPAIGGDAPLAGLIAERVAILVRIAMEDFPTGLETFGPPPKELVGPILSTVEAEIRRVIEARPKEVAVADPALAAVVCTAATRGVLVAARQRRITAPPETVAAELTALIVRYLSGRSPDRD
ncbi:TetR/AcrR family transcriptional regulator [Shumkonia mesophila]|uniref:TetR/AcrR family transcriptional regulator n=1 Tax=Shumkonia mesophila TaxID=2838854 RepID=UPI0029352194|nr:TetR/AcrR family transcriptional regulator [Shumkonia mesophila]